MLIIKYLHSICHYLPLCRTYVNLLTSKPVQCINMYNHVHISNNGVRAITLHVIRLVKQIELTLQCASPKVKYGGNACHKLNVNARSVTCYKSDCAVFAKRVFEFVSRCLFSELFKRQRNGTNSHF